MATLPEELTGMIGDNPFSDDVAVAAEAIDLETDEINEDLGKGRDASDGDCEEEGEEECCADGAKGKKVVHGARSPGAGWHDVKKIVSLAAPVAAQSRSVLSWLSWLCVLGALSALAALANIPCSCPTDGLLNTTDLSV